MQIIIAAKAITKIYRAQYNITPPMFVRSGHDHCSLSENLRMIVQFQSCKERRLNSLLLQKRIQKHFVYIILSLILEG